MKTRNISILRTEEIETIDKNGQAKKVKRVRLFPCKVNAGVASDHRMLIYERENI